MLQQHCQVTVPVGLRQSLTRTRPSLTRSTPSVYVGATTPCNALQRPATPCNALQRPAIHCNTVYGYGDTCYQNISIKHTNTHKRRNRARLNSWRTKHLDHLKVWISSSTVLQHISPLAAQASSADSHEYCILTLRMWPRESHPHPTSEHSVPEWWSLSSFNLEEVELPAKLLECFLWNNKSNINLCMVSYLMSRYRQFFCKIRQHSAFACYKFDTTWSTSKHNCMSESFFLTRISSLLSEFEPNSWLEVKGLLCHTLCGYVYIHRCVYMLIWTHPPR